MKDQVDTLVRERHRRGLLQQLARVGPEGVGRGRDPRGALRAPLRVARAAGGRGRARASSTWWAGSPTSRSTRRTASASGATTSVRIPADWRAAGAVSRRQPARLHRDGDRRASGATSRRSWSCATPVELVGSFDRPNLVYRVLPRATLKKQLQDILARHRGNAGIIYCTSRQGSGRAGRVAVVHRRPRRCRITRASTIASATATRIAFINEDADVDRRHRRVRHGHRPIERALRRSTPARRSRSSTTSRSRAAPGATGSRRSACSSIRAPTS